jgi:hypothetical protein
MQTAHVMSLITQSSYTNIFSDTKTTSFIDNLVGISNIPLDISRNCDRFKLFSIEFKNIDDMYKATKFQIIIGGQIIFSIDFKLLMALSKIDFKYKTIYIPHNLIIPNNELFYLCCLIYHQFQIQIQSDIIFNYKFYLINELLDNKVRGDLMNNSHNVMIRQYHEQLINAVQININMVSSKGLYILGNKISNIKLIINYNIFFNYEHHQIKEIGQVKKLWSYKNKVKKTFRYCILDYLPPELIYIIESFFGSEYLYYIPFDILNPESYLELQRFEHDSVKLVFDDKYNGKVIGVGRNMLLYQSGMGAQMFSN